MRRGKAMHRDLMHSFIHGAIAVHKATVKLTRPKRKVSHSNLFKFKQAVRQLCKVG